MPRHPKHPSGRQVRILIYLAPEDKARWDAVKATFSAPASEAIRMLLDAWERGRDEAR